MCKLNVEHKGWVVAPLIKRKGLQPKRSSSATLNHNPSTPSQYSPTRRSPVRPKSTDTSHKGGNKDRKTTELREIPDSLNEMSAEASEFLLVDEEVPSRSDVSFSVRLPLKPTVDDTTTEKTDMLQAPVHASSSSINTCSDYEGYKRLAATNNKKLMSGTNLQMLHIG